ncbi:hypothetical protein [Lacinutrix sp. Bg11-31]|uniref:hypothetical protein n=1 Tax=Lacinutrix sp. Bg11-31 TaxID=2057808 RepID=UPI000C31A2F6|nr:hypothetical protein [Lacinutrix sp. Bg11-31]AUC82903.1 hypothetical protein CW733_12535 [Lacinutrix sp. Bg11-31]
MSYSYGYTQKNNTFHLVDLDNTKLKIGQILSIDKNTFYFISDEGKTITYKRILDNTVKLEKLATEYNPNFTNEEKNAFKNSYLEAYFYRKTEWEKTHESINYFEN